MRALNTFCFVIVGLLIAGCSSIELEESNPANPRLTGNWVLDPELSDNTPDLRPGMRERKGRRDTDPRVIRQREIRGALGSELAFIVHDFQILSAERLEIELNHDSMGIQYHPGVYRDVSWGERERGLWEVYSGWELGELVVISKANGMRVVERMIRQDDMLEVNVTIKTEDSERVINRVFAWAGDSR